LGEEKGEGGHSKGVGRADQKVIRTRRQKEEKREKRGKKRENLCLRTNSNPVGWKVRLPGRQRVHPGERVPILWM